MSPHGVRARQQNQPVTGMARAHFSDGPRQEKELVSSFHPRSAQPLKSWLLLSLIVGLHGPTRIYILV